MRTGNARTSVKPGRRQETRSVGYAVRPRRLPPTLPPPQSPVGLLARNELSDLVAQPLLPPPRAKRARRRRGPARCQAATLGPAQTTSSRPAFMVGRASRRRRHASCSARLARKGASGQAHRRHRAGRRTRSWRGAPWRRRAGWSCFVDRAESADRRHDPVWTVLLGRAAAAARRPSRACASRPTRACGVPLGSRQLAIEA